MSRAGFGVLTIWCLGCSSFDALIGALAGGDAPTSGCVMGADASASSPSDRGTVREQDATRDSRWCGCDHCIAVETKATAIVTIPQMPPETMHPKLGSALSVTREPHLRPPIEAFAT